MMRRVLVVGTDPGLLHTRSLLLQRTGSTTESANPASALTLLGEQFFHVVVLCHTLPDLDIRRLCRQVDLFWPLTRVLVLGKLAHAGAARCDPDSAFPWRLGPSTLIELTQKLLQDSAARRTSGPALLSGLDQGARGARPIKHPDTPTFEGRTA